MSTHQKNTMIDGYIGLLTNLSLNEKLELISRLSDSAKAQHLPNREAFRKAFGGFDSDKSAEEIIAEIRSSRVSTRQIESF